MSQTKQYGNKRIILRLKPAIETAGKSKQRKSGDKTFQDYIRRLIIEDIQR